MGVWGQTRSNQPQLSEAELAEVIRENQQRLVTRAAYYSTVIGQFRHHYGDDCDLPDDLARRDQAARREAAFALYDSGNLPMFDLAAATAEAFRRGRAHEHTACAFCLVDELAAALTRALTDALAAHQAVAA